MNAFKFGFLSAAGMAAFAVTLAALPARAEPPLTGQALADKYKACWDQFNARQWDEFERCYSAKTTTVAPGQPPAKGGKEIVEKHAKPFAAAFPDVKGELELVVTAGKQLMAIALVRGTHTAPLPGPTGAIPPSGKRMGQLVAHGIESGAGAVAAKEWFIQDSPTMLGQIGVSKAPHRAAIEKGWTERKVVVASGTPEEKKTLALAKQMYSLIGKADRKALELLADDVVDHNGGMPKDVLGKAAVGQVIEGFWQMSSNIKLNQTALFAAGDYVVFIGNFAGVNDGDMPAMGLKKTGKKFKVDFIEITRWQDGKLKELWPFFDGAQFAEQLGLMPPPPAPAKPAPAAKP